MTAHLLGQILIAAMFAVSVSVLIDSIGGQWHRIRRALRCEIVGPPLPIILESTKSKAAYHGR